jgi:glycosyltransferase involved in cell wall biosynthesis
MSYGVPIVTSDLASIRPYVQDSVNGYRVPASDPVAHAKAILKILQAPEDGLQMGRRGQELVKTRYNWDTEEQKLWALYEELLA